MKPHRILLVDNLMIRRYGNLRMGPGRKLMCGAIRNNWRLCEFSDRDMARLLAPLGIRSIGGKIANGKLLKTAKNFRPDIMLIGHCDYICNDTLFAIREALPGIKIAHFNVDPLWQEHTCAQMSDRMESCDALFATTAGEILKTWATGRNAVAYMPNPSDPSMENQDNGLKTDFRRDLFFAGNPREGDPRWDLLNEVLPALEGKLKIDIFGSGRPSIWGAEYEEVLASSKMSLNLNRKEGDKWYSSDRIAHLMGYGILTFQSARNQMQRFFADDETVWFDDAADLTEKILYYQSHDRERASIASAGRKKYHALFNGARVLKFMVETMLGEPYSEPYEWSEEVYR
ncbi:MAG: glycosyltransferase [Kiritimatiellae bacterium]|nr:glycosyltransferase [Kiritimatiellia bacterium]